MAGENYKPNRFYRINYRMILVRMCAALLFLAAFAASADARLDLDVLDGSAQLSDHADQFIDDGGKMDLQMAITQRYTPSSIVSRWAFGYSRKSFWIRSKLHRTNSADYFVVFEHPMLDVIDMYCLDGAGILKFSQSTGDMLPFDYRPVKTAALALRLPAMTGELSCYWNIRSTSIVDLNAKVLSSSEMAFSAGKHAAFYAVLCGGILGISCFIGASAGWRNTRLLAVYALSALSFVLWYLINSGLGMQFIWPNGIWWQKYGAGFIASTALSASALFVWMVIGSKSKLAYVPLLLSVAWLATAILSFTHDTWPEVTRLYSYVGGLHAITMPIVLVIAAYVLRRPGILFLAAGQACFAVPTLVVALWMIGAASPPAWVKSIMLVGYLAKMLFLALSIAHEQAQTQRDLDRSRSANLRQKQKAIEQTEAAVEERTGEISDIVAAAIHDLANPMALLTSTMTEIDPYVDPVAKEDYRRCIEMVSRCMVISNNIYSFERFRATGTVAERKPKQNVINIDALLRAQVDWYRLAMQGRICTVHSHTGKDCFIMADEEEIKRLVDNMLSNFWRHTKPKNRMVILVRADDDKVVVTFEDDGSGIPQLRYSMQQHEQGLSSRGKVGGLYNCFRYVRRNGGTLAYSQSITMGGTCFTFTIARHHVGGKHD